MQSRVIRVSGQVELQRILWQRASEIAAQPAHAADRFAREILAILERDTRACGG
jgi:hypothetical protein